MPTFNRDNTTGLAGRIAQVERRHDNDWPLWAGPCGEGPLGGITQSMIVRFLSCRERFRLHYILGLEPHDRWNHRLGYGNMWHVCEEAMASERAHFGEEVGTTLWEDNLREHARNMALQYPMQRDEIEKWFRVCMVQFPEYRKFWSEHPDVLNRQPLMQEQVFDVPYTLPSGRTVRLRGKFDSVDLIDGGIYLQENKTKGDIDQQQVERQLKFDLQTMLYLVALEKWVKTRPDDPEVIDEVATSIRGVRYNVVRRPLSGGRGSISPHKERATKTKFTPAETADEFYERLRRDYLADDPAYWFFRVRCEVSEADIQVFLKTCMEPLLETICYWYEQLTGFAGYGAKGTESMGVFPPMNYRTPFGVYSALEEGGSTEYDAFMANGSEAGLCRVETLFPELQ